MSGAYPSSSSRWRSYSPMCWLVRHCLQNLGACVWQIDQADTMNTTQQPIADSQSVNS
ncbi:hypothetical protein [Paenibacillus jamilae]|uniref:hypothetical protein n=1 Tax=Paenibacillus jamilae TaxID=114136 RepID=UPI001E51405E|nr:hypothetical protein [Paenibacillus jamilae]